MTTVYKRGIRGIHYATLFFTTTLIILSFFIISLMLQGEENPKTAFGSEANIGASLDVSESKMVSLPDVNFIQSTPHYTIILQQDELRLCSSEYPDTYTIIKDIDPRTLREVDRELLMAGIELESPEALFAFLEDFSS